MASSSLVQYAINLIQGLPTNPWVTLLSLIFGFFGVILYFKGKNEKNPHYFKKSTNVIRDLTDKYQKLNITYDGNPIKTMTVTKVYFWNAGKGTILNEHIVPKDPLCIEVKDGCQILDKRIACLEENDFKLTENINENSFNFRFNHIEMNQGAIFKILHTGMSNRDIQLKGKIIGSGEPVYSFVEELPQMPTFILNRVQNKKLLSILNSVWMKTQNTRSYIGFFMILGLSVVLIWLLITMIKIQYIPLIIKILFVVLIIVVIALVGLTIVTIHDEIGKNHPTFFTSLDDDDSFK
ncbi:hypothetical protein HNV12_07395 [Methanococcoides sp. SA1]|nr:hypothetical protein [Methanococcoides sp. SA1]